jgi:hypothetical protein
VAVTPRPITSSVISWSTARVLGFPVRAAYFISAWVRHLRIDSRLGISGVRLNSLVSSFAISSERSKSFESLIVRPL